MKTISISEFRRRPTNALAQIKKGQCIVLTWRGKPVARIQPIANDIPPKDDPFFSLSKLAEPAGESLSNADIDGILYGGD